MLVLPLMTDTW